MKMYVYGSGLNLIEVMEKILLLAQAKVRGEIVGNGDGTTTDYSYSMQATPVKASTITIYYKIGGTDYTATDDGSGNISGDHCTGTINYTTGDLTLSFDTAPDVGTVIKADYDCDVTPAWQEIYNGLSDTNPYFILKNIDDGIYLQISYFHGYIAYNNNYYGFIISVATDYDDVNHQVSGTQDNISVIIHSHYGNHDIKNDSFVYDIWASGRGTDNGDSSIAVYLYDSTVSSAGFFVVERIPNRFVVESLSNFFLFAMESDNSGDTTPCSHNTCANIRTKYQHAFASLSGQRLSNDSGHFKDNRRPVKGVDLIYPAIKSTADSKAYYFKPLYFNDTDWKSPSAQSEVFLLVDSARGLASGDVILETPDKKYIVRAATDKLPVAMRCD